MQINWDDIANAAANATDAHYANLISSITRLNDDEIKNLIFETGIDKQNLALILKEVKDATKSNEAKAQAIGRIHNGVDVLVAIIGKLI